MEECGKGGVPVGLRPNERVMIHAGDFRIGRSDLDLRGHVFLVPIHESRFHHHSLRVARTEDGYRGWQDFEPAEGDTLEGRMSGNRMQ